ncbi:ribosome-binding protein aMBF1 (putative translation factor) [Neobacillus niacini]|nr:ribosome-binding protein aMBF1 (putative translation factor) [Neobacillus niacini]
MNCELCMGEDATTKVEYQDFIWDVCERCKALAEAE